MAQINTYYRAFIDYRKQTDIDKSCKRDRKVLSKIENAFEKFEVKKYQIMIDETWILEIEKGLEFIEKAIKEDRQFIRTNGEIVPIEKVKKVSRESVAHLAKHSEMITHIPDNPNDTIVPDKIFMVEKLNDYAVYENRFIYMLLCYLRDFIELRIHKINEIRMTYICDFALKRTQKSKKRLIDFETIYHEDRKDNPYPLDNPTSKNLIKRINDCAEVVNMLLNTPLMTEVSKAPMIKPPIVKTNVLKMNNNFKNSLVLYDYIVNYKGDGYSSEEVLTNYIPLDDDKLDEFMELPFVTSFLTYKFGNDLIDKLQKEYQEEEELKRRKEEKELQDKINRLRKKVLESGMGYEEYMLLLEKQIRNLEEDSQNLIKAKLQIVELNKKIDFLNDTIEKLNQEIVDLKAEIERKIEEIAQLHLYYQSEIARINQEHQEEIARINQEHQEEIDRLNLLHQEEIARLENAHQEQIELLTKEYEQKIDTLNNEHQLYVQKLVNEYDERYQNLFEESKNKIDDLSNQIEKLQLNYQELLETYTNEKGELVNKVAKLEEENEELLNQYDTKIKTLEKTCEDKLNEANELYNKMINDSNLAHQEEVKVIQDKCDENIALQKKECKKKVDEMSLEVKQAIYDRNLMAAELKAIRIQNGLVTVSEEYASKERFEELEREFIAFNKFFKSQWDLTKKLIRKQLLWVKPEKKNKKINKILADNASSAIKEIKEEQELEVDDLSKDE